MDYINWDLIIFCTTSAEN